MSKYKLGAKSLKNLEGVQKDLVRVVRRAIALTTMDFTVFEGRRSLAQQKKNVAAGVSWTLNSKHLTGHAVDLVPYIGGKPTWSWAGCRQIAVAMKAAAKELGVTITWGGDFRKNKDGPHFEVDPKKYPL
jgi:peptidoglycan L-alanyl-D-glutamate endopeptidase CwlK